MLFPAPSFDSPLVGAFEVAPIHPKSCYTAISYSWGMNADGDATLCRGITVDGQNFNITQNLFDCLRRLREKSTAPLGLWIDALCIDQLNLQERNAQVARMAKIYLHAEKVIAWLGEGTSLEEDETMLALLGCLLLRDDGDSFAKIAHNLENCRHLLAKLNDLRDSFFDETTVFQEGQAEIVFGNRLQQALSSTIISFFQRRYFKRRWVIQELYYPSAKRSCFHWGPFDLSCVIFRVCILHILKFLLRAELSLLDSRKKSYPLVLLRGLKPIHLPCFLGLKCCKICPLSQTPIMDQGRCPKL